MGISDLVGSEDAAGLTEAGVQAAVSRYCTFEGRPQPAARSRQSVADILRVLVERDDPVPASELIEYFRPVDASGNTDQGRYDEYMAEEWWGDVAVPSLESLPGVERVGEDTGTPLRMEGGTWQFTGLPDAAADAFDPEHVRPLGDLRADPAVACAQALDDLGVPRRSDDREVVADLWDYLREHGSATADDLAAELPRSLALDAVAPTLEALPGVTREVESPPEPEELDVSTMADVIEGHEALDQEPTETWRYAGDGDE